MSTAPLRSELADLFRLLDHVPTGIILLDRQGTVVRINRTASERIAQRETQVLGTDFFRDVVPDLETEGLGEQYRHAISVGTVQLEWDGTITSPRGLLPLWLGL